MPCPEGPYRSSKIEVSGYVDPVDFRRQKNDANYRLREMKNYITE